MPVVHVNADRISTTGVSASGLDQLVLELAAANVQLSQRYEQQLALESRLRHVATGMHRVLDADAILSFGVAELVSAFGDRAVVYRMGGDGAVEVVAQWFEDTVLPIRELDGISLPQQVHEQAWRIAARHLTACVRDAAAAPQLDVATRVHLSSLGVSALLAGSIQIVEDEVLLVVVHGLRGPRNWTEDDIALFEGIVREVTTALRNAYAFEQQLSALQARKQLDRDKDAFVSNVSHELRTPLTSVLGYLELLRDDSADGLTDEQSGFLEIVERNAARLLTLIEDLLLLSTVQDRDRPPALELVRIDELVRRISATMQPAAHDRRLALSTVLPAAPVTVLGDAIELERAVLNLVANAVKFTSPGGRVGIEVSAHGDRLQVRVSDNGVGIPEQEQGRLFERFYRGSAAQRGAVTGSGLGLAITHHIVKRHEGMVGVWSRVGEGTTVTVELPLAPTGHQPTSAAS